MSRITVDAGLAAQLHNAGGPVELCDPAGKVLGKFSPLPDWTEWEIVGPEFSEEELDRRSEPGRKRYSTAEVLEHLRRLG
jgi:hypothetical protein